MDNAFWQSLADILLSATFVGLIYVVMALLNDNTPGKDN